MFQLMGQVLAIGRIYRVFRLELLDAEKVSNAATGRKRQDVLNKVLAFSASCFSRTLQEKYPELPKWYK